MHLLTAKSNIVARMWQMQVYQPAKFPMALSQISGGICFLRVELFNANPCELY